MFDTRFLLVLLFSLVTHRALAQDTGGEVVYGTVIVSRTGERTPIANSTRDATTLTNYGAWQSYSAGAQIRARYLSLLDKWSSAIVDPLQFSALASDNGDYNAQSGEAFMAGLYPPAVITGENATTLDPTNILFNGTYQAGPNNGAQYIRIETANNNDVESIYVDGNTFCPAWGMWFNDYLNQVSNSAIERETENLYTDVANALPSSTEVNFEYQYAYTVFDYVNYQSMHDTQVALALSEDPLSSEDAFNQLRYLSDAYLTATLADVNSGNPITTVAGAGLATQVLSTLSSNINSFGELYKLNVLFTDYAPFMSFFALAGLNSDESSPFRGLPEFGSYAAFELFAPSSASLSNLTSTYTGVELTYPSLSELHVRFVFKNGSGTDAPVPFPLFGTGQTDMSWNDFSDAMGKISFGSPKDWCSMCDAWTSSVFCLAFNATAWSGLFGELDGNPSAHGGISAPVAGVIGALVALAFVAVTAILASFIGGVGLARRRAPLWAHSKSSLGGFKGGDKMASDADLTITKGGAGVSSVEKERVGSWELAPKPAPGIDSTAHGISGGNAPHHPAARNQNLDVTAGGGQRPLSFVSSIRGSFDHDDLGHNPFQDPVKPHERI